VAQTTRVLAAEAAALQAALARLTEQDFNLPSPCPPWSAGELLCHVVIGAGRAGLIARLTGRASLSPTEQNLLSDAGARSWRSVRTPPRRQLRA